MKRNALEAIVLGVSLVAIAALVGVLVIEGIDESAPPDPQVVMHVDQARQGGLGWIVPATVSNVGDLAAEAVVLEASATVTGEPEVSELEVAFLPAGSSVEIAFGFSGPPEGNIEARLIGFRIP